MRVFDGDAVELVDPRARKVRTRGRDKRLRVTSIDANFAAPRVAAECLEALRQGRPAARERREQLERRVEILESIRASGAASEFVDVVVSGGAF